MINKILKYFGYKLIKISDCDEEKFQKRLRDHINEHERYQILDIIQEAYKNLTIADANKPIEWKIKNESCFFNLHVKGCTCFDANEWKLTKSSELPDKNETLWDFPLIDNSDSEPWKLNKPKESK